MTKLPKTSAKKVPFDLDPYPLILPTISGGFDRLQEQIASIVGKVDKIPIESIAQNLNITVSGVNKTLKQVKGQTLPAASQLLKQMNLTTRTAHDLLADDSPLLVMLTQTLQEVLRTMRSVRSFANQLDNSPESLLQGRFDGPALLNDGGRHSTEQGPK